MPIPLNARELRAIVDQLAGTERTTGLEKKFYDAFCDVHFGRVVQVLAQAGTASTTGWTFSDGGVNRVHFHPDYPYAIRELLPSKRSQASSSGPSFDATSSSSGVLSPGSVISDRLTSDVVYTNGRYTFMLKANRGDLRGYLASGNVSSIDQLQILFGQVLTTIQRFREQGSSHGDIKPANILVHQSHGKAPVLLSLGDLDSRKAASVSFEVWIKAWAYTWYYFAPAVKYLYEKHNANQLTRQQQQQEVGLLIDSYATGITLLEVLASLDESLSRQLLTYRQNKQKIFHQTITARYSEERQFQDLTRLDSQLLDELRHSIPTNERIKRALLQVATQIIIESNRSQPEGEILQKALTQYHRQFRAPLPTFDPKAIIEIESPILEALQRLRAYLTNMIARIDGAEEWGFQEMLRLFQNAAQVEQFHLLGLDAFKSAQEQGLPTAKKAELLQDMKSIVKAVKSLLKPLLIGILNTMRDYPDRMRWLEILGVALCEEFPRRADSIQLQFEEIKKELSVKIFFQRNFLPNLYFIYFPVKNKLFCYINDRHIKEINLQLGNADSERVFNSEIRSIFSQVRIQTWFDACSTRRGLVDVESMQKVAELLGAITRNSLTYRFKKENDQLGILELTGLGEAASLSRDFEIQLTVPFDEVTLFNKRTNHKICFQIAHLDKIMEILKAYRYAPIAQDWTNQANRLGESRRGNGSYEALLDSHQMNLWGRLLDQIKLNYPEVKYAFIFHEPAEIEIQLLNHPILQPYRFKISPQESYTNNLFYYDVRIQEAIPHYEPNPNRVSQNRGEAFARIVQEHQTIIGRTYRLLRSKLPLGREDEGFLSSFRTTMRDLNRILRTRNLITEDLPFNYVKESDGIAMCSPQLLNGHIVCRWNPIINGFKVMLRDGSELRWIDQPIDQSELETLFESITQDRHSSKKWIRRLSDSSVQSILPRDHLLCVLKRKYPTLVLDFAYDNDVCVVVTLQNGPAILNAFKIKIDALTHQTFLTFPQGSAQVATEVLNEKDFMALLHTMWISVQLADPGVERIRVNRELREFSTPVNLNPFTPIIIGILTAIKRRFPEMKLSYDTIESLIQINFLYTIHHRVLERDGTALDRSSNRPAIGLGSYYLSLDLLADTVALSRTQGARHQILQVPQGVPFITYFLQQSYDDMRPDLRTLSQAAKTHALCHVRILTQETLTQTFVQLPSNTYLLVRDEAINVSQTRPRRGWMLYYMDVQSNEERVAIPIPFEHVNYQQVIFDRSAPLNKTVAQLSAGEKATLSRHIEAFHERVLENRPVGVAPNDYLVDFYQALNPRESRRKCIML